MTVPSASLPVVAMRNILPKPLFSVMKSVYLLCSDEKPQPVVAAAGIAAGGITATGATATGATATGATATGANAAIDILYLSNLSPILNAFGDQVYKSLTKVSQTYILV